MPTHARPTPTYTELPAFTLHIGVCTTHVQGGDVSLRAITSPALKESTENATQRG